MKLFNQVYHTIWEDDSGGVHIIDQRYLPHRLIFRQLETYQQTAQAISEMWVRGAPLIGVTASYGIYLAAKQAPNENNSKKHLKKAAARLLNTRPTAVNLNFAIKQQLANLALNLEPLPLREACLETARQLKKQELKISYQIGLQGLKIIEVLAQNLNRPLNILTHCNAGWLACIDWGTATAPIYMAHQRGIPVHVWVDETRPRNQGARLTAFELAQEKIPHTLITDNTGGHLMQHKQVDLVLVGTDRTTANGDVANKIGTYLKALAAYDNQIPFYVAVPSSSIDWTIEDGLKTIPIETRSPDEVKYISGLYGKEIVQVLLTNPETPALNYGFDVTPARLITGLITEKGCCKPGELHKYAF